MGQARKRGSFEDRRQQSIAAARSRRTAKEQAEADWWNSLTYDQKRLVRRNRENRARRMSTLVGITAMLGGGTYGRHF
jgi:hypothetical protein